MWRTESSAQRRKLARKKTNCISREAVELVMPFSSVLNICCIACYDGKSAFVITSISQYQKFKRIRERLEM